MKTKYWILLIAVVLVICLGLSILAMLPQAASDYAEIYSDGVLVKTVSLRIDQQFSVPSSAGGTNLITVQSGRIAVTEATCPDHYCMKRGFCDSGADIVCLPNRLVIRFVGAQEIDAVIG